METATLEAVKLLADIVGTSVTAIAVVVGGLWAYFKLVKGRTYRPRLEVGLFGQWRALQGKQLLHVRITVKNIGISDAELLQKGTGLRVSMLVDEPSSGPAPVSWQSFRVFTVLREHAWIEPGETVSDDLLLRLDVEQPVTSMLEARLVWRWARGKHNVVVVARRILAVEARLDGTEAGAPRATAAVAAVQPEERPPLLGTLSRR